MPTITDLRSTPPLTSKPQRHGLHEIEGTDPVGPTARSYVDGRDATVTVRGWGIRNAYSQSSTVRTCVRSGCTKLTTVALQDSLSHGLGCSMVHQIITR